jgi:hypothetical protein
VGPPRRELLTSPQSRYLLVGVTTPVVVDLCPDSCPVEGVASYHVRYTVQRSPHRPRDTFPTAWFTEWELAVRFAAST